MELHIPVSENLSLFAGITEREADSMTIYPPERSLFDQLCTWLDQRPSPMPPWPERSACLPSSSLYPHYWSLTESSSQL